MRAAHFHPGEGLRIETIPGPGPGPGEVLVEPDDVPATHQRLEHGEITGRAVVVP